LSREKLALVAGLLFTLTTPGFAQENVTGPASSSPVVSRSEAECTGFIASPPLSTDLYVSGGVDADASMPGHASVQGDTMHLRSRAGHTFTVGSEYRVVRPAKEDFRHIWYYGQSWNVRALGTPYEDVGRVRVTQVTSQGTVARVAFSCGAFFPKDILLAYQPRPIPEYTPSLPSSPPAAPRAQKMQAMITAAKGNAAFLGRGSIVYLDVGEVNGIGIGERFRIHPKPSSQLGQMASGLAPAPGGAGELIVLSVQSKSSVAVVTNSTGEISSGDRIELE
jgi:hypothetical protein